ncbi:TPA: hypothetical protein JLF26_005096 [Escherichia coli]|nr:hypothetical protein [Escherichia coli]
MKYLAVPLAILSAGSAIGAELINYVPTRLEIHGVYQMLGSYKAEIHKYFDTNTPIQLTVDFVDKPSSSKTPMIIKYPHNVKSGSFTYDSSGPIGGTVFLNDNYEITVQHDRNKDDSADISYIHSGQTNLFLPYRGSSDNQRFVVRCPALRNIRGEIGANLMKLGATVNIQPTTGVTVYNQRLVSFTCLWHLQPVYNLDVTIEKTEMSIVGAVGSSPKTINKLILTGNGGAVQITIDNPSPKEISTTFSETDPNALTTTSTPTMGGTTVPFYVHVQNTRAGTRTYTVRFSAAYI